MPPYSSHTQILIGSSRTQKFLFDPKNCAGGHWFSALDVVGFKDGGSRDPCWHLQGSDMVMLAICSLQATGKAGLDLFAREQRRVETDSQQRGRVQSWPSLLLALSWQTLQEETVWVLGVFGILNSILESGKKPPILRGARTV